MNRRSRTFCQLDIRLSIINIQIVPTPSRYVKVYDATSDIKLAEGTAPSVQMCIRDR